MKSDLLKNKYLYKIAAIIIKYLPSVLAIIQMILTGLNFLGIIVPVLPFIGGTSIAFLGLLYLLSYLFQYCYLYRLPLGYNLAVNLIILLKAMNILPIELFTLYRILGIITGIFISIFVFFMYKIEIIQKLEELKTFVINIVIVKYKRYG